MVKKEYSINLDSGLNYRIQGVCNKDCRDLDLSICDENGNRITTYTDNDSIPILKLSPR